MIINIIEAEFTDYEYKRGSHIVINDSRLRKYWELTKDRNYAPGGILTIPVKSGQKVKSEYVSDIIKSIKILEMMEGKGEKES